MLRPERMSKVSVTGSKGVMPTVIETIHDLNLVHLSDYDGSWEGFENGNPIEGADDVSEKLVTVRALESTLDLEEGDVVPTSVGDDWEDRLEEIRTRINELDDRRAEINGELRQVEEEIDRVAPFAELGIDLDLLSGYDSVEVLVGEGSATAIEESLEAAEEIRAYETFTGGDVVAIVAAPTADDAEGVIGDALVGVEFSRHEVPETEQSPRQYVGRLEDKKRDLEGKLEEIDAELEEIKDDEGGFLLALEEELSIEAQRADAPLQFATTRRAFIAEGWVPEDQYADLEAALEAEVGDRIEIEQLEVVDYDEVVEHDHHDEEGHEGEDESHAEPQKAKAATDGGQTQRKGAVTMDDEPPVRLSNLTPAKPFELMVKMVSQPRYSELDPTLLIFLTYPFAFGFMIGDIAYGILYILMGYGAWKVFDSDAGKALGTIGIWAGVFTIIFGWLYDDIFGFHMSDVGLNLPLAGTLDKGLQAGEWAMLWIVVSLLFGLIHLNMGLIAGFVNELSHGLKAAVYERFSWILAMNGLFIWMFSHQDAGSMDLGVDTTAAGTKPEFLAGATNEAVLYYHLGFEGLPEVVGLVGLAMLAVGMVLVTIGEGFAGVLEAPAWAFGHVLSYLRMVAVLLAKGGMAFAVNLLVFGASAEDGYISFAFFEAPSDVLNDGRADEVVFEGLMWAGLTADSIVIMVLALFGTVAVFIFGHILVLLLGITAAGIQMLRLEYVEFFQKFYEGGGEEYEPFGHEPAQTSGQQAD